MPKSKTDTLKKFLNPENYNLRTIPESLKNITPTKERCNIVYIYSYHCGNSYDVGKND